MFPFPLDDVTKKFLRKILDPVFGFPTFVRFCWSTVTTLLDGDAAECVWEEVEDEETFDDDDDSGSSKSNKKKRKVKPPPITQFFKRTADSDDRPAKKMKNQKQEPSAFFLDRQLKRITSIDDLW